MTPYIISIWVCVASSVCNYDHALYRNQGAGKFPDVEACMTAAKISGVPKIDAPTYEFDGERLKVRIECHQGEEKNA